MTKKALITGASGFVGKHLKEELQNNGYQVITTDVVGSEINMDITNEQEVLEVLSYTKPDYIFHLAAIAFVPTSWEKPEIVFNINALGSLKLFEVIKSLKKANYDPTIQIACSSEEYGEVHDNEIPINEYNPLRPLSPYGVSKVAMDLLGYVYYKSCKMKVIRTRAFNHEGYGRGDVYSTSTFCKQAVMIEKGLQKPVISHGNLDAQRDFTDVRDMVRAYRLAVEKGEPGEIYNIGSGVRHTIKEVLETVRKYSTVKFEDVLDPEKMRPADVMVLMADSSKFRQITGWRPIYNLDDIIQDCLKYWRERL